MRRKGYDPTCPGAIVLIVGIDPGTVNLGWGVIEAGRAALPAYRASGVLHAPADWPRWRRIEQLGAELDAVLAGQGLEAGLDAAALESGYVPRGRPAGVLELAEARGVASYVCARRGLGVLTVSPSTVKLTVAGHGRALKEQVQRMIRIRLRLKTTPREDEADALGVALAAAPSLAIEGIRATA